MKGIAGDCYFNDLSNSEGLDSLGEIRGNANFSSLTETLNLTSLEYVGEDLDLSNLKVFPRLSCPDWRNQPDGAFRL